MRSLKDIGNIEEYRRVVAQLASRVGRLMDFHALAADSGVNQITVKKYVTVWQESLIGFLLPPFFLLGEKSGLGNRPGDQHAGFDHSGGNQVCPDLG